MGVVGVGAGVTGAVVVFSVVVTLFFVVVVVVLAVWAFTLKGVGVVVDVVVVGATGVQSLVALVYVLEIY